MSWGEPVAQRINYWLWFYRLIAWDSLLPAVIVAVPMALHLLFPNAQGVIDLVAVVIPVVALFIRYRAGRKYILANQCSVKLRHIQFNVMCLGIFSLALFDSFIILTNLFPNIVILGNLFPNLPLTDLQFILIFLGVYLLMMSFAMYPGRTKNVAI
jgi:hypothetical protein